MAIKKDLIDFQNDHYQRKKTYFEIMTQNEEVSSHQKGKKSKDTKLRFGDKKKR